MLNERHGASLSDERKLGRQRFERLISSPRIRLLGRKGLRVSGPVDLSDFFRCPFLNACFVGSPEHKLATWNSRPQ